VKVTYGEKLAAAVKSGLKTVGDFFSGFLLWFLEALPTLILLAVLAGIVLLIIFRARATKGARQEKKARKAAEKAAKKAAAAQPAVQPAAPAEKKEPPAGT
jgi:xanthine/uracil/vitamin C permease (AzgA family)